MTVTEGMGGNKESYVARTTNGIKSLSYQKVISEHTAINILITLRPGPKASQSRKGASSALSINSKGNLSYRSVRLLPR